MRKLCVALLVVLQVPAALLNFTLDANTVHGAVDRLAASWRWLEHSTLFPHLLQLPPPESPRRQAQGLLTHGSSHVADNGAGRGHNGGGDDMRQPQPAAHMMQGDAAAGGTYRYAGIHAVHGTAVVPHGLDRMASDAYLEHVVLSALQGSHAAFALLRLGCVR